MADSTIPLTRTAASEAVESIGWRYLLGALATSVEVPSFSHAAEVGSVVAEASGEYGDTHLRVDLRADRVEVLLQTHAIGAVTDADVALARAVSEALTGLGLVTAGSTSAHIARPVGSLEMAIDAIDIPAVRPFWKAVMGYIDDPAGGNGIVDPAGQMASLWFQQMDAPRPQRNRIHFDVTVAHDEGASRVKTALEAGGVMIDDSYARSFWVLADVEGNEVCVCTWLDRDERD